jgi:tetratricopeptide (TPR) repeat protein
MSTSANPTPVEQIAALLEQSRGHHEAGDLDAAEAAAQEGLAQAELLHKARPRDRAAGAALARALHRMGCVCRDTDRPDEAEAAYRRALPLLQHLAAHAESAWPPEDLAATHRDLGQLLADSGRKDEAVPHLRDARALWERLAEADQVNRDHPYELAGCCFTLGCLHAGAGKDAAAEKNLKQALGLWEALLKQADDPNVRYYLGRCYSNLVTVYRKQGRNPEAEEAGRKAVATFEALRRGHPDTGAFVGPDLLRLFNEWRCLHFTAGRAEEAKAVQGQLAAVYQELAGAAPNDPGPLRELTQSYYELANWFWDAQQRLDEAEAALRQALAVGQQQARAHPGPDSQLDLAGTWFNRGALCWKAQRPDAAEEAFRQAHLLVKPLVQARPDVPGYADRMAACQQRLGIIYEETGRFDQAAEAYQKARTLREHLAQSQPDDAANATDLGGILCSLGNVAYAGRQFGAALKWYRRSVAWLKEVVRKHGPNAKATQLLAQARAGRADTRMPFAVPSEAEVAASSTFGFRMPGPPPRFPTVSVGWPAGVALEPGALDIHLSRHADDIAGWFWKARRLGQAGDFEQALLALDRLLARKPDHAAALYDRADLLRCLGRPKEALEIVDGLLKAERRDAGAWYLRGLILGDFLDARTGGPEPFQAGRNDQAIDAFDKALLLRPDDADARLYKGLALLRAGAAAQSRYRTLADAAARSGMAEDAARAYLRPHLLAYRGCLARARECFDHVTRLRPDDGRGWYHKGRLLVDLESGDEAAAEDAFLRAVEYEPNRADAWVELARLAERRGDCVQALAHLRRAVAVDPGLRDEVRETFMWVRPEDL